MTKPSEPSTQIWDYKPWWCQPWSILLTGISVSTGSWWLGHRWWLTVPISWLILLWWWYFLGVYPRQFRAAMTSISSVTEKTND